MKKTITVGVLLSAMASAVLAGGGAQGSSNGTINGSLNGTINGQSNGTFNGQSNGTLNGQINGSANGARLNGASGDTPSFQLDGMVARNGRLVFGGE